MRQAEIQVAPELIINALHLPPGTEIFGAYFSNDLLVLRVEHHSLPEENHVQNATVIFEQISARYEVLK